MKVRLIIWALVLAISAGLTILPDKFRERAALKEAEYAKLEEITIFSDLNIKKRVKKFFKTDSLKGKYRYSIIEKTSANKNVDVFITTDGKQISEGNHSILGYTPMVVLIGNSDHEKFKKYADNKLISSTAKIKFDKNDDLTIDFSKVIDAIINQKDWSAFGGDNIPLKIYCPLSDTVDGDLFTKFLLITLNNGTYPSESKIQELQEKINLFFASPYVERININEKLDELYIADNEIYCAFEADLIKSNAFLNSSVDYSVFYPDKTIIRKIYFQVAPDKKSLLGQLPYHSTSFLTSIDYYIRHNLYYRTTAEPNSIFEDDHINMTKERNIKEKFLYIDVPIN